MVKVGAQVLGLPSPRREVSNEEYQRAWTNRDNVRIMVQVMRRYHKRVSREDLQSAASLGLWRALQYHREGFGQKFTTSLYRFVFWECSRAAGRKEAKTYPLAGRSLVAPDEGRIQEIDDAEEVNTYLSGLRRSSRKLLKQYYLQGFTLRKIAKLNGYSREAARRKLHAALAEARGYCGVDIGEPSLRETKMAEAKCDENAPHLDAVVMGDGHVVRKKKMGVNRVPSDAELARKHQPKPKPPAPAPKK